MTEKSGKINYRLFRESIQNKCGKRRPDVHIGAAFGVDVAVIDLPDGQAMALTSDPLSLIPSLGLEESAWLSVQLMANDIATTGFAPMYAQLVLNLPAHFSKNEFNLYWDYIHRFCNRLGVAITGGHTGFIEGQNSTIAGGGTFITIAPKSKMLVSAYAKPGDSILVTKTCALSSAAILAMSFPETVKHRTGLASYQQACASFYHTSSLEDARTAVGENNEHTDITAMHDVTEGGVLGAIYELAIASGNGAMVYNERLPVGEIQAAVCEVFSLDPRYCVGAGSMIITCKKDKAAHVINRLAQKNIPCAEVGHITTKEKGIKLIEDGKEGDLIYIEEDPYWAAFFNALNAGLK